MKPEAQIIAIAAACGWHPDTVWQSVGTDTHCIFRKGNELRTTKELPDWLNDLNAIHEAVMTLPEHGEPSRDTFLRELQIVVAKDENWMDACVNATAAQRAESLLKALGQWRDE